MLFLDNDPLSTIDYIATYSDVELSPVLVQLERAGFHLCGSRFFNMKFPLAIVVWDKNTDWDFCGEYGVESVAFLLSIGFEISTPLDDPYTDDTARIVLSYYGTGGCIQVVLRDDVDAFVSMLDAISCDFYKIHVWKSGPRHPGREEIQSVINQLLAVHEAGQQYAVHTAEFHSFTQT